MNLKALITTFVLGSSSAAMAKPVVISGQASASVSLGHNIGRPQPVVRDHRVIEDDCDHPVAQPVVYTQPAPTYNDRSFSPNNTQVTASGSTYLGAFGRGGLRLRDRAWNHPQAWFNLSEATRIDHNREFFNLRQEGGRFTQIRLQNLGGRTEVSQIAIEFVRNGVSKTQKIRLNTTLGRNDATLAIALAGDSRDIQRIIVYGESGRGAAYQILAM